MALAAGNAKWRLWNKLGPIKHITIIKQYQLGEIKIKARPINEL